jgi:hypothetical protein
MIERPIPCEEQARFRVMALKEKQVLEVTP